MRTPREHEMRVARVEAVGDAPTRLVEQNAFGPDRPVATEGPVVDAQTVGELVGTAFVERHSVR